MHFIAKYLGLGLVVLPAVLAVAQTAPTSPGRQRAANRQALREARRTQTPYTDSHLAVTRQHLRRGSSEGIAPTTAPKPRFGRDGSPRVSETRLPGLRWRRPATEPAP